MWKRLTWECAGARLDFRDDYDAGLFMDFNTFRPNQVSGVFDKRAAPGLDGIITYSAALSERALRIEAQVQACYLGSRRRPVEKVIDEYTRLLCNAFNPCATGRLTYSNHNGSYYLTARAISTPAFGEVQSGRLPFTVDLYADDAYWSGAQEYAVNIGASEQGIETLWEAPFSPGQVYSMSAVIPNQSVNVCYPIIRFWESNAQPKIRNENTGKMVALNTRVDAGHYVEVDTHPARGTITLWKESDTGKFETVDDVSYWLSRDSDTDFALIPGENRLIANGAVAGGRPAVTVLWHERVLGV